MLKFTATPKEIIEKGQDAIQLMEGVVRLSGAISPRDAKDLQVFSDKMEDVKVALQLLVDSYALFTISNTLNRRQDISVPQRSLNRGSHKVVYYLDPKRTRKMGINNLGKEG